jgi:hypothetical protein
MKNYKKKGPKCGDCVEMHYTRFTKRANREFGKGFCKHDSNQKDIFLGTVCHTGKFVPRFPDDD